MNKLTDKQRDTFAEVFPIIEQVSEDFHWRYRLTKEVAYDICVERASMPSMLDRYRQSIECGKRNHIESDLVQTIAKRAIVSMSDEFYRYGGYWYQEDYIDSFLPFWFNSTDWPTAHLYQNTDRIELDTFDAIATAIDLKDAWEDLRPEQKEVIWMRWLYADQSMTKVWYNLGKHYNKAPDTVRNMYKRAITALTFFMNHRVSKKEKESK